MTPPNVVFIIADQHRWDFMGCERNGVTHTPNLDRIADQGAILSSAYCTSPLCCPSRAAIASGRYGMSSGCFTNLHQLPPGTPSFVGQFRQAGYRTCAIGKHRTRAGAPERRWPWPCSAGAARTWTGCCAR